MKCDYNIASQCLKMYTEYRDKLNHGNQTIFVCDNRMIHELFSYKEALSYERK